jgi:hypothetical protein
MRKDENSVELYIDRGKGTEQETLVAFRALEARKSEIEEAFGEPLVWQELPQSRGCRICFIQAGGWRSPEDTWPNIQDTMIDAMVRLEKAVKPHLVNIV